MFQTWDQGNLRPEKEGSLVGIELVTHDNALESVSRAGRGFRQPLRSDAVALRFTTIRTTPKQFDRVTF